MTEPLLTEPLLIETLVDGEQAHLLLVGELTYPTVPLFTAEVEQVLGVDRPHLHLDVGRLHFCDSVGLGALIGIQRRAECAGGGVVLSGVHGCLQRNLQITGTDVLFTTVGGGEQPGTANPGRAGETA